MMGGLKHLGIIKGEIIDDIMEKKYLCSFLPSWLTFLGLDTPRCRCYPKGVERIDRPGIKFFTLKRTQPGMVITFEPGIYFVPAVLEPAMEVRKSAFLDIEKVKSLLNFGGIRIEDDILVTDLVMKT